MHSRITLITFYMMKERNSDMWTPCDDSIEEYNEKTGKMETHHKCPYADTYAGYEDEMCRNCCGLGVDDDNYDYDEEQ